MYDDFPGADDDILTIEVFGGSSPGGGDVGGAVKQAAHDAAWALQTGGTAFVVIGGVLMIAGGWSAWTGGGAGVFVGGAVITVIGAGALTIGFMLEDIYRDPPQADFRRAARVVPARMTLGDLDRDLPSPANRAVGHLNALHGLAPAALDALERMQGAALAGDAAWHEAWRAAVGTLDGLTRIHLHGLGAACADLADGPGAIGIIPQADLVAGLEALQAKKGLARLTKTLQAHGVPEATIARAVDRIGAMGPRDLPGGADLAASLRAMARQLQAV